MSRIPTYNNLSNDFGLSKRFDKEGKEAAGAENYSGLYYQQWEGEVQRILTLPSTI